MTLLVVGVGTVPEDLAELQMATRHVPAFAVSFALIAMFWVGHVRWRHSSGDRSGLAQWLSLALVFLVLVYVYPLRPMALSLVGFFSGEATRAARLDEIALLFTRYGLGFTAMAGVMAALWAQAVRAAGGRPALRAAAQGECVVWVLLMAAGLLAVTLAQFRATAALSPWAYALLPVAIGLFVGCWDWGGDSGRP